VSKKPLKREQKAMSTLHKTLRIAARFFDRSADTKIFKRGMAAHNHPDFYRQLGREPGQIVANALDVLARRFSLN
jgi:hypothetical protein